jgi:hypothetical protein
MTNLLRSWNWREYIGLAVFLAVALSIPIVNRVKNGNTGKRYHQQLLGELSLIHPPSGVLVVRNTDHYSPWTPNKAVVGTSYKTAAPYPVIREFYDQQLRANGWLPVDTHSTTDWGKDLGGNVVVYCKGPLQASLQYAGSQANYGWTFAFDLSWGLGAPKCR